MKQPEPAPVPATQGLSKNARKKANKKAAAAATAAGASNDAPAADSAAVAAAAAAEADEMAMLEESAAENVADLRANAISSVWTIESQSLDADAEMRRKFGGRAVRMAQREAAAEDRQQHMIRGHGRGGGGRAPPAPRRVLLVAPQPAWGRPHGLITMRELTRARGSVVYEFNWSADYARMHESFEVLVASSADPNMLLELLRHEPCHLGALAQLHEVASHTGQAEQAVEFLSRLLWTHEASYAPGFKDAMLKGEARLRAGHPPNRHYLRALHKHAVALGRRGCHHAALSAATLLLSFDRNDATKVRCWLDVFAVRAEAWHVLLLHALDDPDACGRLPGWAFTTALALHELAAATAVGDGGTVAKGGAAKGGGATPKGGAGKSTGAGAAGAGASAAASSGAHPAIPSAAAAAIPSPPPWAGGGDARQLRRALLQWPSMLPAALQACAASSSAATALAARWETAVDAADAAAFAVGGGAAASAAPPPPPNGARSHLEALYWERASELWSKPDRIGWLQQVGTALLAELQKAVAEPPTEAGAAGEAGAAASGVLSELRELREQARRYYPPGGGNPFRGFEFTSLRAEQVVIPEEEAPPQGGGNGAPEPPMDVGDGGDGDDGGGGADGDGGGAGPAAVGDAVDGGGGSEQAEQALLAPLVEEAEALDRRVEEMERLTKGGGAAHLRAMLTQRLATLDERLTKQMIDIDNVNVEGDAARAAKRALTRRMDLLCTRVAAIEM